MSLKRITLLGITGSLLQIVIYTLTNFLKLKIPYLIYFNYISAILLISFFICFFLKQKGNKSILKNATLLAAIGQCILLISYILQAINNNYSSIYSKSSETEQQHILDYIIRLDEVISILTILGLIFIISFFIIIYLQHRKSDSFRKFLLITDIIGCFSIISKIFCFVTVYLLPYDVLNEASSNVHDKICNISFQIDNLVYPLLLIILTMFFIILYIRQNKIKEA